jgi:hypothetical protein
MSELPPIQIGGDLSKPATTLIEKISDAFGGAFKPWQLKRIARAEAEADIIRAHAEVQVSEIKHRAMHRFLNEETKKQENIEAITVEALPLLDEDSDPSAMEDDWIANFFDKCRIISDVEMRRLWAKVLAGEANSPGTYSKRTVNFLSSLDKSDAASFARLCGFVWFLGDFVPLIYDCTSRIYTDCDIHLVGLQHLQSIGLINFAATSIAQTGFHEFIKVHFHGNPMVIRFPAKANNILEIGSVTLTRIGQQLAPVSGATEAPGFMEYVLKRWTKADLRIWSPLPRQTCGAFEIPRPKSSSRSHP